MVTVSLFKPENFNIASQTANANKTKQKIKKNKKVLLQEYEVLYV